MSTASWKSLSYQYSDLTLKHIRAAYGNHIYFTKTSHSGNRHEATGPLMTTGWPQVVLEEDGPGPLLMVRTSKLASPW